VSDELDIDGRDIDAEIAYAAQHEDESLADAEEDEDLAATQEAFERQKLARDADLSDNLIDELGHDLVWRYDTSLRDAHSAMADLFDEVLAKYDSVTACIDEGAPADAIPAVLRLNWRTGPMVLASIQLMGLFVPELREEIVGILRGFETPTATADERAAIEAAAEQVSKKRLAELNDEIRKLLSNAPGNLDDAELGLDLN
jgi:hypothetical protein